MKYINLVLIILIMSCGVGAPVSTDSVIFYFDYGQLYVNGHSVNSGEALLFSEGEEIELDFKVEQGKKKYFLGYRLYSSYSLGVKDDLIEESSVTIKKDSNLSEVFIELNTYTNIFPEYIPGIDSVLYISTMERNLNLYSIETKETKVVDQGVIFYKIINNYIHYYKEGGSYLYDYTGESITSTKDATYYSPAHYFSHDGFNIIINDSVKTEDNSRCEDLWNSSGTRIYYTDEVSLCYIDLDGLHHRVPVTKGKLRSNDPWIVGDNIYFIGEYDLFFYNERDDTLSSYKLPFVNSYDVFDFHKNYSGEIPILEYENSFYEYIDGVFKKIAEGCGASEFIKTGDDSYIITNDIEGIEYHYDVVIVRDGEEEVISD